MKTTLSTYQIAAALIQDENANWSRSGSLALAEYLEEMEECTGEELELDVVAIRCDFSQFESLQDWITEYYGFALETSMGHAGVDLDGEEDYEAIDELIREHIQDHGHLVEFDGGIIVSSF
tara:strand:- start:541 stop:903 length:363 start_codon:yes stop_codon:yes gene_type:complete